MQEKEKMKVLKNSNYEIEDEKVEEVTGGCGQIHRKISGKCIYCGGIVKNNKCCHCGKSNII